VAERPVALPPVTREDAMITSHECRQNAEECLRWAREAKTDDRRKAFLDMARTWTEAATQLEVGFGLGSIWRTRLRRIARPMEAAHIEPGAFPPLGAL
jgi:hypothetical protein